MWPSRRCIMSTRCGNSVHKVFANAFRYGSVITPNLAASGFDPLAELKGWQRVLAMRQPAEPINWGEVGRQNFLLRRRGL